MKPHPTLKKKPAFPPRKEDRLVTVARFGNAIEAHLAQTKLQSEGVESYVSDEHLISLMPVYDNGLGGVRLKVGEGEAEKAVKILVVQAQGTFWKPRPLVFAAHFFSAYFFAAFLIVLAALLFLLKKFIFWFLYVWKPLG